MMYVVWLSSSLLMWVTWLIDVNFDDVDDVAVIVIVDDMGDAELPPCRFGLDCERRGD